MVEIGWKCIKARWKRNADLFLEPSIGKEKNKTPHPNFTLQIKSTHTCSAELYGKKKQPRRQRREKVNPEKKIVVWG